MENNSQSNNQYCEEIREEFIELFKSYLVYSSMFCRYAAKTPENMKLINETMERAKDIYQWMN